MPDFAHWVGQKVHYTSRSGKKYVAMIDAIPENPVHAWTDLPTVSLSFRDERRKLVRKVRVMPRSDRYRRKVWRPLRPDDEVEHRRFVRKLAADVEQEIWVYIAKMRRQKWEGGLPYFVSSVVEKAIYAALAAAQEEE